MAEKLIINFAPTGMIPTKRMTPHVPVSVSEIVEDVHEATELGISMVHVHARDPRNGSPTYKAEVYVPAFGPRNHVHQSPTSVWSPMASGPHP